MAKMDNSEDINVRRDCVPSCLSIYLNEDLDTLVKEYVNIREREAFLSSLKLLPAAEDLRQSVKPKPKPDVKRSKASLDTVQSLLYSRKSLHLKEARNLTLRGGLTYEHAFRESKILRSL
ncbi:hypothetical protein CgunFtcFv8_002064 [Champsocephalus gunnari]|uniref:Uncharacterized protein n=1 Tax=Champsocephalus gunnari TaxID=52237 RepID=A0AAN8CLU1_CHAGU|nr:hypothetical protein CgunFtcFv8_002064 [Champsocephalus gunnari]